MSTNSLKHKFKEIDNVPNTDTLVLPKKKEYRFLSLRQIPSIKYEAAQWFENQWKVSKEAYLKEMDAYLKGKTEYGWYLCMDGKKIIGGLGVIENDFHKRKELTPNICAVYVEESYRCQGIAGMLLKRVVSDLKSKQITPVYLLTDTVGFYERYGFEFLCMVQNENEPGMSRMYIHR